MPCLKGDEYHYFVCVYCIHVTKAKSRGYAGKCPLCGVEMMHECSDYAKLKFSQQKGGDKDATKG